MDSSLRRLSLCALAWFFMPWAAHANATEPLTLTQATTLVLKSNPRLQSRQAQQNAADGLRAQAALRPGFTLELEADNPLGRQDAAESNQTELTLSLGSVLERGGKRAARMALASAEWAQADLAQQQTQREVLSEVARCFIDALTAQAQLALAQETQQLAVRTLSDVRRRSAQGAANGADVAQAEADLAWAEIAERKVAAELAIRRMALAALWGAQTDDFGALAGTLDAPSALPSFSVLMQRVQASPAVLQLAQTERIEQARVQLVESDTRADVAWQVGVRHEQVTGANAALLRVSVPLLSGARNQSARVVAAQRQVATKADNAAQLRALHATLFDAWQQHASAVQALDVLRQTVIPARTKSLEIILRGYQQARFSYRDLAMAQAALYEARSQALLEAQRAQHHRLLIESLTGLALDNPPTFSVRSTQP